MRAPLNNWDSLPNGYTFGVKTTYSNFHLGIDKTASKGTSIYAPTSGHVDRQFKGSQGGNTIWFKDSSGKLWRFLHLDRFGKSGNVKEGDILGYVGSTGLSTGSHLHADVSKNGVLDTNNTSNFIDPDQYIKENINPTNMNIRHWVKMTTLAYGLVPTPEHVDYWSGQSDERIMNDLPAELCRRVDNDGTASTRVDYFNKLSQKSLKRDFSVEEQKTFSDKREPLRGICDYILSK